MQNLQPVYRVTAKWDGVVAHCEGDSRCEDGNSEVRFYLYSVCILPCSTKVTKSCGAVHKGTTHIFGDFPAGNHQCAAVEY